MKDNIDISVLVADELADRDRRFSAVLDGLGIQHNGPQSVEMYVDNGDLYCIPDRWFTPEGVSELVSALAAADLDYGMTAIVEEYDRELEGDAAFRQAWPEDESYGPGLLFELDRSTMSDGKGYRLHLWLDLDPARAEEEIWERLAERSEGSRPAEGGA